MVERDAHYADPRLVALYDALNGWSPARDYYLALAHDRVRAVVDFGCGTGLLTARFAAPGRRVVGVDPSPRMLEAAKARDGAGGVEWRVGSIGGFDDRGRFDLAVMTGHAFQCLLTDAEISAAFANVAKLLRPGGLFVFETRNPAVRPWERWRPEPSRTEGALADGRRFEMRHDLISVDGELVAFETVYEIEGEPA
ncbi:MAG: class I SAM-dependent methyltransferase, partial [Pseudomonadota bacterium]